MAIASQRSLQQRAHIPADLQKVTCEGRVMTLDDPPGPLLTYKAIPRQDSVHRRPAQSMP